MMMMNQRPKNPDKDDRLLISSLIPSEVGTPSSFFSPICIVFMMSSQSSVAFSLDSTIPKCIIHRPVVFPEGVFSDMATTFFNPQYLHISAARKRPHPYRGRSINLPNKLNSFSAITSFSVISI